ncbi:MAG TPA: hypothetical protein VKU00_05565 [Chthonomonadaceae bacterium]|nr:hypothetical protein [Chthonomonadaceae bacterium]
MKKQARLEYRWYLSGCQDAGITDPLPAEAFWPLYRRYRLLRPLVALVGDLDTPKQPPWRMPWLHRLAYWMLMPLFTLNELGRRVKAGRQLDSEGGGAPVPARIHPRPPALVGAGAKLLPPLDPEPDVRDP